MLTKMDCANAAGGGGDFTFEGLTCKSLATSISSAGNVTISGLSEILYVSCGGYATIITDDGTVHYAMDGKVIDDPSALSGWKMTIDGNIIRYPNYSSQARSVTFVAFGNP